MISYGPKLFIIFFISTAFITLFKLYSLKLFLLIFFICTTFITLFKLYYPKSTVLANNRTPFNNISQDEVIQLFIEWKKEQGRVYKDNEEMAKKFVTFVSNFNACIEHNANRESPSGWTKCLNLFADFSQEEFAEIYLGGLDSDSDDDIELNDLPHIVPPSP
ncbi:hypothetical protein TanjilG_24424 [Lupinus angustifolius]|uniref:Cathepsin propeptide inhibitor domain-containing protein n=1 Tax=Lupinus angustifolius TaxID=3871 RepID=A0A1J7IFY9_LUPAN|nr:hypothetical protein TanjilG_24424 [Lupinus angustifolius]